MTLPARARAVLWVALAVGASAAGPLFGPAPEASSAIVFTPMTADFGAVRGGSVVRAEFPFVNRSTAPIRILSVYGTCGCVKATASSSYIEPGASGKVDVAVVTEGRSGPQRLRIVVKTDEGAGGTVRLTLKGEIKVALRARPARLSLGSVAPGAEITKEIRVEKLEPVPEVTLTCTGEGISATKSGEDEHGLTVRTTIRIPWRWGRHSGDIRLAGGQGSTSIAIGWIVRSPFELSRKEIELRSGKGELDAKPRWPTVTLSRVDTHGLPLRVSIDGARILVTLEGSPFDVPSGATIELVPDPPSFGNMTIPVYVGTE